MSRLERRTLLRAAGPALAALPVAGCLSSEGSQADSSPTPNRDAPTTETAGPEPEYGPWSVELDNDLDDEVAVTVELRTPEGEVVRKETYDLRPGDAISPITVSESGTYAATVETAFGTETAEFTACKLNSDLHVAIRRTDAGRTLAVTQRHQDPGTERAGEGDLLACDD